MPSPRMPPSPREAPSTVHSDTWPLRSRRLAEQPAGPAVERDAHARRRCRSRCPARPGTLWLSSGISSSATSWRLPCAFPCRPARAGISDPASQPRREASQPQNSTPAMPESGRWRTRTRVDAAQLLAPLRADRRSRPPARATGCPAARPGRPRRPPWPARCARATALAGSGSLTESTSTTWDRWSRASTRLAWPCGDQITVGMSVTTSGSTIVSSLLQVLRAEVEHDALARQARARRRGDARPPVVSATVASMVLRPGSTAHRMVREAW